MIFILVKINSILSYDQRTDIINNLGVILRVFNDINCLMIDLRFFFLG